MKRFRLVVFVLVPILVSVLPCMGADPVKLDLNAIYGSTSFHTQGATEFAELVKKHSGGSVVITVHPGGSLGFKGPELLKSVKDGSIPMSDILMGVVAGSAHVFGTSTMPRLVKSYDEARALYDDCKPLYEKTAQQWNQKFLYAAPWPPSGLVTKKPVTSKADLAGIKTRTYDKNGAEFLRALGASPVSLPWGEVYASLRTGMIDSVLTSTESAKNGKFWEVLSNFTEIDYAYPLNMVTINTDYWKALSKDQQDAVLKAAAEIEKIQWDNSKNRTEESAKVIREKGITVSALDPALGAEMDKAARQIIDEFMKKAKAPLKMVLQKYVK